jgi:hypothetical protein
MKRDMDLVRAILLELERHASGFAPQEIVIDGFTADQIGYHIHLMMDAGLVEGSDITCLDDASPQASVSRMTWAGHEFNELSRNIDRWQLAKRAIAKLGGATLDVWKAVLADLIARKLG